MPTNRSPKHQQKCSHSSLKTSRTHRQYLSSTTSLVEPQQLGVPVSLSAVPTTIRPIAHHSVIAFAVSDRDPFLGNADISLSHCCAKALCKQGSQCCHMGSSRTSLYNPPVSEKVPYPHVRIFEYCGNVQHEQVLSSDTFDESQKCLTGG